MCDDFDFAAKFREAQKAIEENLQKELEQNFLDLSVDNALIDNPFTSVDKCKTDDELIIKTTNSRTTKQKHEEPLRSKNVLPRGKNKKLNTIKPALTTISIESSDSDCDTKPDKKEDTEEDFNYEQTVLVKWIYVKNYRIPLRRFQKLSMLQAELAKLENVKAEDIMLLLRGTVLDPNECLYSLNITPKDVIDAMPGLKDSTASVSLGLQYKIQMKNRKKPLYLHLKENDTVKVLLAKIGEELGNIPLSKLRLKFDGDVLLPEKTALDQDLEGGECLDLEIID